MSSSRFARLVLILLVLAAVTTPSAWGAPLRLTGEPSSFEILARLWESLVSVWNKAGCGADPHGLSTQTSPPTTEAGCILDPHGACIEARGSSLPPQPPTEAGCGLDPHGGCIP